MARAPHRAPPLEMAAVEVAADTEAVLRALLRLDPRVARRIAADIGHRRRPHPQQGPSASY